MSSAHKRHLSCTRIAGIAVAATSVVGAGVAVPAGAMTPPPAARSVIEPSTPGCLVGAALMFPLFLGMVLVMNPTFLPDAAAGYWTPGKPDQHGDVFPGWLQKCGLDTGVTQP